jgi:hypothetical protein
MTQLFTFTIAFNPYVYIFILNLNELERNYKLFSYAFTQANLHNLKKM